MCVGGKGCNTKGDQFRYHDLLEKEKGPGGKGWNTKGDQFRFHHLLLVLPYANKIAGVVRGVDGTSECGILGLAPGQRAECCRCSLFSAREIASTVGHGARFVEFMYAVILTLPCFVSHTIEASRRESGNGSHRR